MQASSDNAQGVIQNTADETGVCAATPNWCAVLSCNVNYRDVEAVIFQTLSLPHLSLPLPPTKNEKTTVDNFF